MSEFHLTTDASAYLAIVAENARGEFLSPYTATELANKDIYINADRTAGYLIDNGDLQGVVSNKRGAGFHAIRSAMANGAQTLDCMDGFLPEYYGQFGFRETGRVNWNDDYAPENWDYDTHGRPDIVFMSL